MKQGTRFEKLTENIFLQLIENPIYDSVEHNVMLDGEDGKRQIDVLITSQAAGMKIKTIVECKDHKNKVSVGTIDALYSVIQDVNANKGVVVSCNGFTSTAIQKAKRLGISLYTAHEALNKKWEIDIEIPVLVTEIISANIKPSFIYTSIEATTVQKDFIYRINDVDILETFTKYLEELPHNGLVSLKKNGNNFIPKDISPPFYVRDSSGKKLPIDDLRITFDTTKIHYFGYLNEKNDTLLLKDIIENQAKVLFNSEILLNYKETLRKIKESEIPSIEKIKIKCLIKPELTAYQHGPIHITKIK